MLSTSAVCEVKVMDDCSCSSARMMVLLLGGDLGLFELVLQPGDKVWHKIYGLIMFTIRSQEKNYMKLNATLVVTVFWCSLSEHWPGDVQILFWEEFTLKKASTLWAMPRHASDFLNPVHTDCVVQTVYKVKHCSKSKRYFIIKKRGTHLNILWNTKTSGRRWYFI